MRPALRAAVAVLPLTVTLALLTGCGPDGSSPTARSGTPGGDTESTPRSSTTVSPLPDCTRLATFFPADTYESVSPFADSQQRIEKANRSERRCVLDGSTHDGRRENITLTVARYTPATSASTPRHAAQQFVSDACQGTTHRDDEPHWALSCYQEDADAGESSIATIRAHTLVMLHVTGRRGGLSAASLRKTLTADTRAAGTALQAAL